MSEPFELFVDVRSGKVLTEQMSLENTGTEKRQDSSDVLAIGFVLSRSFPIEKITPAESRPSADEWTGENIKKYGEWVLNLLQNSSIEDVPHKPTRDVVRKLDRLGQGPSEYVISREHGSLSRFQRSLGFTGEWSRGAFSHWTTADYTKHIATLGNELGRKPRVTDLRNAFRNNGGPSIDKIAEFGIGKLQELAGYVNARTWEKEDFVDWGVRFMVANGGHELTLVALPALSAKGLAPGLTTIYKYFGSFVDFKAKVDGEYSVFSDESEQTRQANLSVAIKLSGEGLLGSDLGPNNVDAFLAQAARVRVAKELLPGLPISQYEEICREGRISNFVKRVVAKSNGIAAGDVEQAALILNVFDDLWPFKDMVSNLRIK